MNVGGDTRLKTFCFLKTAQRKMTKQLLCLLSVELLTAALLMTGCVVYGSPTDQDKWSWSNHDHSFFLTDCSPPDSPLVLNKSSIQLHPDSFITGHDWSFTASFELKEEVSEGTFNYTARWSPDGRHPSIVLVHQQVQLCDYVLILHLGSCPIKIGHHVMRFKSNFSPIIPAGYYSFDVNAVTSRDRVLSCLKGMIHITK